MMKNLKTILFFCSVFLLWLIFPSVARDVECSDQNNPVEDVKEFVVLPTGVDDTGNLQAAFDAAIACGKRAVVKLRAGHYFTSPVLIKHFRGKFTGAGTDKTIVHFIPGYDFGSPNRYRPPASQNPWPAVFTFSGGDVIVRDIQFRVRHPAPCSWICFGEELTALNAFILFAGEHLNSHVTRVAFEGLESVGNGSINGFNINNALNYAGDFSSGWHLKGAHEIKSCSFKNVAVGISCSVMGQALLDISGNTFQRVHIGCQVVDLSGAEVDISNNFIEDAGYTGILVSQGFFYPWLLGELPPEPTVVRLRDNTIILKGGARAIQFCDKKWISEGGKALDLICLDNKIR